MRSGVALGAVVPTMRFWNLARIWYEGRMELDWEPRTAEESQALLRSAGLMGSFWDLT